MMQRDPLRAMWDAHPARKHLRNIKRFMRMEKLSPTAARILRKWYKRRSHLLPEHGPKVLVMSPARIRAEYAQRKRDVDARVRTSMAVAIAEGWVPRDDH